MKVPLAVFFVPIIGLLWICLVPFYRSMNDENRFLVSRSTVSNCMDELDLKLYVVKKLSVQIAVVNHDLEIAHRIDCLFQQPENSNRRLSVFSREQSVVDGKHFGRLAVDCFPPDSG